MASYVELDTSVTLGEMFDRIKTNESVFNDMLTKLDTEYKTNSHKVGTNGIFVRSGNHIDYLLNKEVTVASIASEASTEIDTIPTGYEPLVSTNYPVKIGNAVLSIKVDLGQKKVLLVNTTPDKLTNIKVPTSNFSYIYNNPDLLV